MYKTNAQVALEQAIIQVTKGNPGTRTVRETADLFYEWLESKESDKIL